MFDTKLKYVRLPFHNSIIIFPMILDHSEFKHLAPISAGFCYINPYNVDCFGESTSLKLKADPKDSEVASKQLFGAEAVLN